MKIKCPYVCDVCGTQKREANHWFIAYLDTGFITIRTWDDEYATIPETIHLCGLKCTFDWTQKTLETLKG